MLEENKIMKNFSPNLSKESHFFKFHGNVAGVDEAGVGPLAGPVVAAAVVLDVNKISRAGKRRGWWSGVKDSKMLSAKKREEFAREIYKNALSVGIAHASVEEIDRLNILRARLLAMKRAVESLKTVPGFVLIDGNKKIPGIDFPQEAIVKGDMKVLSIACASILAKVTRDGICGRLHKAYPEYGFDKHKGYPTKMHFARLKQFGPCAVHRKSFSPVKILLEDLGETFSYVNSTIIK